MAAYQSINMVVITGQRFVRGALAAAMILSMSFTANAADLLVVKPIKLVGPEIEVVLDINKKEVRINRFAVVKDLPTGKLQHQLAKPYVVRLKSVPVINPDGMTKFKASDWYDGIGVKLEIELYIFKSGHSQGTVNITSQHEETTLFYSAQQLEVQ